MDGAGGGVSIGSWMLVVLVLGHAWMVVLVVVLVLGHDDAGAGGGVSIGS